VIFIFQLLKFHTGIIIINLINVLIIKITQINQLVHKLQYICSIIQGINFVRKNGSYKSVS